MKRFLRPLFYCLGLLLFLGYGSLRLQHSAPMVQDRLERWLGRFFTAPVRVEGCEQPSFALTSVRRLTVKAAPALVTPDFLVLGDLHVEEKAKVRAREGALNLERESPETLAGGAARWNFEGVFSGEALRSEARGVMPLLRVDSLAVALRQIGAARDVTSWQWEALGVVLRPGERGGLRFEADLAPGEFWSQGYVGADWAPGTLRFGGHVENLRRAERWLPVLPEGYRRLWRLLAPEGEVSVDLEEAVVAGGLLRSLKAVARHYDTSLCLGRLGLALKHLSGPTRITEAGVSLEGAAGEESLSGAACGLDVRVEGELGEGGGKVRLRVPAQSLRNLDLSAGIAGVEKRSPADSLGGVEGTAGGEIEVSFDAAGEERWQGTFRFQDVAFSRFSWLAGGNGVLRLEGGAREGSGSLALDRLLAVGVGRVQGKAEIRWGAEELQISATDLSCEGEAAEGTAPASGSISGTLRRRRGSAGAAGGGVEPRLELRWIGLSVATRLFSARDVSGEFLEEGGEARGRGKARWNSASVPAALAGGGENEAAAFSSGSADVYREGRRFLVTCKLAGERHALRARGAIEAGTGVEMVVVLSPADNPAFRDDALDGESPERWKEAAGAGFQAYRVTGTPAQPLIRAISASDPAFLPARP
jgi:hypothetical protein